MYGRKLNTVKSNTVDKIKGVSEVDPGLKFTTSDFEEEVDSAKMMRERTRGSKLEGQLRTRPGKVIKETAHTIIFLPKGGKKEVVYSKQDVAKTKPQKKIVKPQEEEQTGPSTKCVEMEESSYDETYVVSEESRDGESTPRHHHHRELGDKGETDSEKEESTTVAVEAEKEEMATPQEMPVTCEEPIPTKENNPGKGKKKAVKASVMWSPQQKETRRRRPTERYGIDVVMQIEDEERNMKKESKNKNT